MKAGKVWGETELLLDTPSIAVHRLTIKRKAQCSKHLHRYKFNAFLCIRGRLYIDVWKNDYKLCDTTELNPGDFMTVAPNEKHLFRTEGHPCVAVEMYYLPALSEDIVRATVGKVRR